MRTLAANILEHAQDLPEGVPVSTKELRHLGSRAAVGRALSKLARRGDLMRIDRGIYVRPIETRFGKRAPSVESVVRALACATSEIIAPHGAAAANTLGLTTQVPMRAVYLTWGRSRRFKLGAQTIELRYAPAWQLVLTGRLAGDAIRALAWLGRGHAARAMRTLRRRLPASAFEEIARVQPRLPTWLAQHVNNRRRRPKAQ